MDDKTRQIVRWTVALTDMTARLGERKYISTDAKTLLMTTDQMLHEMLETLGIVMRLMDPKFDQESFDDFSARVAP